MNSPTINLLRGLSALLPPSAEVACRGAQLALSCTTARYTVALLCGRSRETKAPATLLVAGEFPWAGWLPERFFAEAPERRVLAQVPVWRLPTLLHRWRARADLTVARVDRFSARLFFDSSYLAVPEWVGTQAEVPLDVDAFLAASRARRDELRMLKREGLRSTVAYGGAEVDSFYNTIYAPMTRARHGDLAALENRISWHWLARHGGVLWIEQNGRRVGGEFFVIRDGAFIALGLGAIQGPNNHIVDGVRAATYVFAFELARKVGCSTIDFGGCRPSLHDGLMRHKRRWGVAVAEHRTNRHDLLVRWGSSALAVGELLSHTSLVFRGRAGLSLLCTIRTAGLAAGAAEAADVQKHLGMPGIARLFVAARAGWQAQHDLPSAVVPLNLADLDPARLSNF